MDGVSGLCTLVRSGWAGAGPAAGQSRGVGRQVWDSNVHSSLWLELGAGLLVGGDSGKMVIWENLTLKTAMCATFRSFSELSIFGIHGF